TLKLSQRRTFFTYNLDRFLYYIKFLYSVIVTISHIQVIFTIYSNSVWTFKFFHIRTTISYNCYVPIFLYFVYSVIVTISHIQVIFTIYSNSIRTIKIFQG